MPYDAAERIWKFHVVEADGQFEGCLFTLNPRERYWTGTPQNSPWEFLYQTKCGDDILYIVLYKHKRDKYSDRDYCKVLTEAQAAEWLVKEDYDLPDDLKKYAKSGETVEPNQNKAPLPDAQQAVWDLLKNKAMSAKEIAQALQGGISPEAIIKRISAIRKNGRKISNQLGRGYWRPDAPPPEDTGAAADSE
jgi:biotin operon repressor